MKVLQKLYLSQVDDAVTESIRSTNIFFAACFFHTPAILRYAMSDTDMACGATTSPTRCPATCGTEPASAVRRQQGAADKQRVTGGPHYPLAP
eukprot:3940981-Rhodomonas_salina.3